MCNALQTHATGQDPHNSWPTDPCPNDRRPNDRWPNDRWYDRQLYAGLHDCGQSLRIVHVCKFFPPERGGMETYVHDLAQEQAAAGHQVTVLAHTASASRRESIAPRCQVERCKVWFRAGQYAPVAPMLPWALRRTLRRLMPHILHVHCPNPAALWCLALSSASIAKELAETQSSQKRTTCPDMRPDSWILQNTGQIRNRPTLVVHWHSDAIFPSNKQPAVPFLRLWRMMEHRLLQKADRIIATSQAYLDSSEFLSPWRSKCVVAPMRISTKKPEVPVEIQHKVLDFLLGPVGETTASVLAVGRLAHYKGFDVLIKAVAQVPTTRCCIIGTGEEHEALQQLITHMHLENRVLLAGDVDDTVLTASYEACDVFCLPSTMRTEAFGIVLLEAQRAGKWCIATKVQGSGMSTIVQDNVNGWLVEPGDVAALAERLGRVGNLYAYK